MTVCATLHRELARHRSLGLTFTAAWKLSLPVALSQDCAGEWATILKATRHAWQAGYERQPWSRREAAASMIRVDNGVLCEPVPVIEPEPLPPCAHCGDPVPPVTHGRQRKYCTDTCRKAAFVNNELAIA